jgi:hypothetical protein
MEKPLPPAYWGLCEAVLETRVGRVEDAPDFGV